MSVYDFFCNYERIGRRTQILGELPPQREVIRNAARIAMPSLAESFLIALVALVDTYMVSGLGDYAIAAVGLTTQPKFFGLAAFFAISMSVSALVARRRGENRQEDANRVLQQALLLALVLTVFITALLVALADPIITMIGAEPETHGPAVAYLRIIILGMVFNVITIIINAAQRGVGNTKIALRTNIVANLVNVVFNYLLIGGNFGFPRLEVAGAAIATVIGTVCACAMALRSVLHPDGYLNLAKGFRFRFDKTILSTMTRIAAPTMAEQIIMRIGFTIYIMLVARLGTLAYAAHQIGMNLMQISFSFADGLSVAAIAMVGRSLGQKRPDLALIYSSVCQRFGLCFSFLVAAVYIPFGRGLFSLFSKSPEVQQYGTQIMPVIAVIVFIQISMMIFTACLRAAGDVKYVMFVSLIGIGVLRPLVCWVMAYALGLGLLGAWLGMLVDQCARFVLNYRRYRQCKWMHIVI